MESHGCQAVALVKTRESAGVESEMSPSVCDPGKYEAAAGQGQLRQQSEAQRKATTGGPASLPGTHNSSPEDVCPVRVGKT